LVKRYRSRRIKLCAAPFADGSAKLAQRILKTRNFRLARAAILQVIQHLVAAFAREPLRQLG
jgi:hypothetical protein